MRPVVVVCPNVSTNALGRALVLADGASAAGRDAVVVGQASLGGVWSAASNSRHSIVSLGSVAERPLQVLSALREYVSRDHDVIISKPRHESLGLCLAVGVDRKHSVLDIDDWELGFASRGLAHGETRYVQAIQARRIRSLLLAEGLEAIAKRWRWKLASNSFLQQRFGAILVPHVREVPALVSSGDARMALGLSSKIWLGFIGTPRLHKGLDLIINAMGHLGRRDLGLLIAGASETEAVALRAAAHARGVESVVFGRFPMEQLPTMLAAVDAAIVPSEQSTATAGQVPAKLFDAMANARAIITSRLRTHEEVVGQDGLYFDPGDSNGVIDLLRAVSREDLIQRGARLRDRFIAHFSVAALADVFSSILLRL